MPSMLDLYRRPTVLFDVANKQHRQWAHEFLTHRSWSGCPVQFALPLGEDNVHAMLQRQMARYYIQREFGALPPCDHEDYVADLVSKAPKWRVVQTNR